MVDGQPGDILHDEVGPAFRRGAGIENLGDGRVVHEGESLAFGFKSGHHLTGIHADLDQLERHLAVYRLLLFGQPHLSHAAFADQMQQLIRADDDRNRENAAARVDDGRSGFCQVLGWFGCHAHQYTCSWVG